MPKISPRRGVPLELWDWRFMSAPPTEGVWEEVTDADKIETMATAIDTAIRGAEDYSKTGLVMDLIPGLPPPPPGMSVEGPSREEMARNLAELRAQAHVPGRTRLFKIRVR